MGFIDGLKKLFGMKEKEVKEQEQKDCGLPFTTPEEKKREETIQRAVQEVAKACERVTEQSQVACVKIEEAAQKATENFNKAVEESNIQEAVKVVWERAKEIIVTIPWEVVEAKMRQMNMDEWEIEKAKMSNNERRRKKMPMVRRQAHLRNIRNLNKRKK